MVSRGVDRFRLTLRRNIEQGRVTSKGGARTALSSVITPTAQAIRQFMDDTKSKAGPNHTIARLIKYTEPEVLAYLAARALLHNQARRTHRLTAQAEALGAEVEMEEATLRFEAENPALCKKVLADLNSRTGHEGHRVKVMRHVLREHSELGWKLWSTREKVILGTKIIELLVAATGIATLERHTFTRNKETWVLNMSPSFFTWIEQLNDVNELKMPAQLPTVIPPKPWTSPTSGGYWTDVFLNPHRLVRRTSEEHMSLLEGADLSEVYSALNAVQETAWKVDRRTLEVAEALISSGTDLGVLPPMEKEDLPPKPHDIADNAAARKLWKVNAKLAHERNERSGSKRVSALKQVALGREFVDYPAIYFPHSLDFRGRMYPIPVTLSPQESDLARGMLVFAEGKPIVDSRAEGWLAIHGANLWGEDKSALDTRIQWTIENTTNIVDVAAAPLDHLWWTQAEEPFAFLTWCFEWADYMGDTDGTFLSHIPIAMDGTCNGLQHYSAMLRDPVGGAAVNLLPADRPQDIYEEVAKVVRNKLLLHPAGSEEGAMAQQWLSFGIDRKLTKRPVMVLPYGGTQKSCRTYVNDAVTDRIAAGDANPFGEELHKASNWLAAIVWQSIGEVVVAAQGAMGWLRAAARRADNSCRPLVWTAPSGFPVLQAYKHLDVGRVNTTLFGSIVKLSLVSETDELDRRRQVNGVAPNFVHSMDAAALVGTVNYAVNNGVGSYAMVHDSYGTHAADTDMLAACIRHAFVDMYEDHDVLREFGNSVSKMVPDVDLPEVPPFGTLDLKEVLESQFFFA